MPSGYGTITVPTAGTPVAMSAVSKKVYGLTITPKVGNTGPSMFAKGISALSSNPAGVPFTSAAPLKVEFGDLKNILLDVGTNNDKADFFYMEDTP